jgi:DNA-binding response OmpR family regulator
VKGDAARILLFFEGHEARDVVAEALRRDGYAVHVATRRDEAVPWGAIDLLLATPGGLVLGATMRADRSSVPIIVVADPPEPWIEREAARIGAIVLDQPFPLATLRRTVLTAIAHARFNAARCRSTGS